MQSLPRKACKFCNEPQPKHWPYQCRDNPKAAQWRLNRKKLTNVDTRWQQTKRVWMRDNQAESYNCFYCGKFLWPAEVTLDHYHSRSRHPELRYELSNLRLCCWSCNGDKGSTDGDDYIRG